MAHLVLLFMGQASNDVRRKLQKIDGVHNIDKLLEAAWKVFQDRGSTEEVKTQASKKAAQEKSSKKTSPTEKDQCVYCKKWRH